MSSASLAELRESFGLMGIDCIPLQPNSKVCNLRGWNKREPERLWQNAPPDANLGVRCGGVASLAVLDCDDKNHQGTFENALRWLDGLGVDETPIVRTASGVGRHIYLSLDGSLPGEYSLLKPEFGAGEFRYGSGCYVVAPPSNVEGNHYELISGTFEWLPQITIADVLPILSPRDMTQTSLQKFEPTISKKAWALLHGAVTGYRTRSEAEQALILSLVNTGHDFDGVLSLFLKHPCAGKFSELHQANPKRGMGWLKHSYDSALQYSSHESPTRRALLDIQNWATNTAWTGRTGAYDRAVFLAHVQKAYNAGSWTYNLSVREGAELAGVTAMSVSNANKRLEQKGLLIPTRPGASDCGGEYRLTNNKVCVSLHILRTPCEDMYKFAQHDLFRRSGGLGKAAAEIFTVLMSQSATIQELVERTGRHRTTVKRCLARMSRITNTVTGELVSLVEQDGDNWRVAECADIDAAAVVLGVAGAGARQRLRHLQERHAHRRLLASYKNSKMDGSYNTRVSA